MALLRLNLETEANALPNNFKEVSTPSKRLLSDGSWFHMFNKGWKTSNNWNRTVINYVLFFSLSEAGMVSNQVYDIYDCSPRWIYLVKMRMS
jgi:hypothetical protein